jgi:hypothetical protein
MGWTRRTDAQALLQLGVVDSMEAGGGVANHRRAEVHRLAPEAQCHATELITIAIERNHLLAADVDHILGLDERR